MARPRAEDYDDKRKAILKTSAELFAEHGFDRASMNQIALGCGVSKALLYHYYPGKDALVFAIIRNHLIALDAAIAAADDPALPAPERLRVLVRTMLETYRDADNEHKVQLGGTPALTELQRAEIQSIERRIVRRFAAVLHSVNPALSGDRPLLMPTTMSLFGMMNWAYMWFREEGPISRPEYADLITRMVLDGIRQLP